jgi:hypothetical protein
MRDGDIVFRLPSDAVNQIARQNLFTLRPFSESTSGPALQKITRKVAAACPTHCDESTSAVVELELPIEVNTIAYNPLLLCNSEGGGIRYVERARINTISGHVTAKVRAWDGDAQCTLSFEVSPIEPPVNTSMKPASAEVINQSEAPIANPMALQVPSIVVADILSKIEIKKTSSEAGAISGGTSKTYNPNKDENEINNVFPRLKIGSSQILVDSSGQIFDFRTQLEEGDVVQRRAARTRLATIIEKLNGQDVGAVIQALPNSSYRVAVGVVDALGQVEEGWTSSEPKKSQKLLELLPRIMNTDDTIRRAVDRALKKMN